MNISYLKQLKSHEGFKRYFSNTSWLFFDNGIRLVLGLVVGVWLTRYLGPQQFGTYSYVISFVGLFAALAPMGLDNIVVRDLVQKPKLKDVLIGTSFWLRILGSLLLLFSLGIATFFTPVDFQTKSFIFIVGAAPIFQSFAVIDLYFQSRVQSKFVVLANLVALVISSIVKISLIYLNAPLVWFFWILLAESILIATGLIYSYSKVRESIFKWKFQLKTAKDLMKNSWPLIFSGLVISVYMKIDQVMIKQMLGDEQVGIYAAAVRLSEAWYFIPMLISSSLFAAIINAKKRSAELYHQRLQKLFNLMVIIALSIAVPVSVLNSQIVGFLYGDIYSPAGPVLAILSWSGVFLSLGVASSRWFIIENLQILSFVRTFFGMIINIIMNFILIPRIGIQGAAISTLASQAIAAYFSDFLNSKTRSLFYMKSKSIFFISRTTFKI